MLFRATTLTALCALSGLQTSVSSTVGGNKEVPSEHRDANGGEVLREGLVRDLGNVLDTR